MLINPKTPDTGICFAWTPKWTPEGTVWLEWVHYEWMDHGFGGWRYARWVPQARYDAGERREFIIDRGQPQRVEEHTYRIGQVSKTDRMIEY